MFDPLTARWTFACPSGDTTRVTLSAFRHLERLPGAAHPAVYRIRFECGCGDEHDGLVSHDELDWAPLGLQGGVFLNVMTGMLDDLAAELSDVAAAHIRAGEWPWSFYCYPEDRPRPVFPSSFFLLAPGARTQRSPGGRSLGLAVRCPACHRLSVNLVSHEHVDLPFHNDAQVGVVEHVFADDALRTVQEFREELHSARFDGRRLCLE